MFLDKVDMSGVTDEERGMANVTVRLRRDTLERLDQMMRSGHRGPGDPTPAELIEWAVSAYIEMREREK